MPVAFPTGGLGVMIHELTDRFPHGVRDLDREGWRSVYVVGDVHGCAAELSDLLQRIGPAEDDLVLCAGDVVRKGPGSREAVEIVMRHPNVAAIRGNNEEKILRGRKPREGLGDEHLREMESWPLAAIHRGALVVHAGYDPTRPLRDHAPEDIFDLTWIRTGWGLLVPWFELHDADPFILFGHVPAHHPIRAPGALGLDTACVYGGRLTACDPGSREIVQVPARRTYRERRPEKFYDAGRELRAA